MELRQCRLGLATAHERYHYAPLRGVELDRYYREFTRVGYALGGTDLPASKAEVLEVLESWVPKLALLPAVSQAIWPNNRHAMPIWQWPPQAFINWFIRDMQPRWARSLYMHTRPDPLTVWSVRQALKVMLNSAHLLPGPLPEFRQAQARVTGVPLQPIRFDPDKIAAESKLSRGAIERLADGKPGASRRKIPKAKAFWVILRLRTTRSRGLRPRTRHHPVPAGMGSARACSGTTGTPWCQRRFAHRQTPGRCR